MNLTSNQLSGLVFRIDEAQFPARSPASRGPPIKIGEGGGTLYEAYTQTPLPTQGHTSVPIIHTDGQLQYWALILTLFPVITVFGNGLVVLSVIREPNLHTATNYFIVSLAVADISLAVLVMPPSAWVELNHGKWRYGRVLCDVFCMFDILLCTASILNLMAISMDRYVAVKYPVVYSRHSNNVRVGIMIALTWILSLLIALPIACGLNNTSYREDEVCALYHTGYIITSSIGSFYLPCAVMIVLYYNVFHAICVKARASRRSSSIRETTLTKNIDFDGDDGIEVIVNEVDAIPEDDRSMDEQSQAQMFTATITEEKRFTNMDKCVTEVEYPAKRPSFQINGIQPNAVEKLNEKCDRASFENMKQFRKHLRDRIADARRRSLSILPIEYLGQRGQQIYHSKRPSYKPTTRASNHLLPPENPELSLIKYRRSSRRDSKRPSDGNMGSYNLRLSRSSIYLFLPGFFRDKSIAKRERKVTKTLAIVLGVFLICWMPFFTINIIHGVCFQLTTEKANLWCAFPRLVDSAVVWLGYINSFLNPIIYTTFNAEFRKAFKKILHCK